MNLKDELQSEQVNHLDLAAFCQVESGTTIRKTLAGMQKEGHHVCLIFAGARLKGILTDRDVLRKIVTSPEIWDEPVDTVMTPNPSTIRTNAPAAEALWLMDQKHFRNLPAVDEDGAVLGNMTHQSVINYLAARYPTEILNLPPRPNQFPRKAEGG